MSAAPSPPSRSRPTTQSTEIDTLLKGKEEEILEV